VGESKVVHIPSITPPVTISHPNFTPLKKLKKIFLTIFGQKKNRFFFQKKIKKWPKKGPFFRTKSKKKKNF